MFFHFYQSLLDSCTSSWPVCSLACLNWSCMIFTYFWMFCILWKNCFLFSFLYIKYISLCVFQGYSINTCRPTRSSFYEYRMFRLRAMRSLLAFPDCKWDFDSTTEPIVSLLVELADSALPSTVIYTSVGLSLHCQWPQSRTFFYFCFCSSVITFCVNCDWLRQRDCLDILLCVNR